MTILFLVWESLSARHMIEALQKMGYNVVLFPFSTRQDESRSEALTVSITEQILANKCDFVFSFNYFDTAAIACKACQTTYVSWVYDSPYIGLYSKTVTFDTNRIFVFDSGVFDALQKAGIETVHYLPLASSPEAYDQIIAGNSTDKYNCDIAFVGATKTESDNDKFKRFDNLDDYTKGYLQAVINSQKYVYGYNFVESTLTPKIMESLLKAFPLQIGEDSFAQKEWLFANYYICQKITGIERCEILNMLAEKYHVNLYTISETPDLPKVHNMGEVNYYEEAPLAYRNAKINLNISLKSIINGIPLRAFDIMASKGFLLTNYQADFAGLFEPGVDFVYYEDYADLMAKAEYYLTHDSERLEIASNGYNRMKELHTFEHRISLMFKNEKVTNE